MSRFIFFAYGCPVPAPSIEKTFFTELSLGLFQKMVDYKLGMVAHISGLGV
jgi:hypothetical protein